MGNKRPRSKSDGRKNEKTLRLFPIAFLGSAADPAGYEHWTAEQFREHENALHKGMKDGLASETLGSWENHLLLKTRRESSSGRAELHQKQPDPIVVQSGHATIIIGGRILNGQTTAPNEIRGTAIEGGERQRSRPETLCMCP
jgi:hypothetical protein